MNNDLIRRNAVIAIIKKKRLMTGKHDLSAEYKLAGVQEDVERLPSCGVGDVLKMLEKLKEDEKLLAEEYEKDRRFDMVDISNSKADAYGNSIKIVKSLCIE